MKTYLTSLLIMGLLWLALATHAYGQVTLTVTVNGVSKPQTSGQNVTDLTGSSGGFSITSSATDGSPPVIRAIPASESDKEHLSLENAKITPPSGGGDLTIHVIAAFPTGASGTVTFQENFSGTNGNCNNCSFKAVESIIQPPSVNQALQMLSVNCCGSCTDIGPPGQPQLWCAGQTTPQNVSNLTGGPRTHDATLTFHFPPGAGTVVLIQGVDGWTEFKNPERVKLMKHLTRRVEEFLTAAIRKLPGMKPMSTIEDYRKALKEQEKKTMSTH